MPSWLRSSWSNSRFAWLSAAAGGDAVFVAAAALVPRGAIVESPSFAAPADDDAASGPGAVVAADDDGELVDVDAFVDDDGVADCAAAPTPVAAELESAALASVAPAMPIVETINADTSLLLNGGIMFGAPGRRWAR